MSIFKETLPKFIIDQLAIREAIIKQGNDPKNPRTGSPRTKLPSGKRITIDPGAFYTNTLSNQCVLRMSSRKYYKN